MSSKTFEEMIQEFERGDDYWTELAIIEFTEVLIQRMQGQGITRTELARRMGKSKSYVTKVLQGDNNFTIATMVSLIRALGGRLLVGDHAEKNTTTAVWQAPYAALIAKGYPGSGDAWIVPAANDSTNLVNVPNDLGEIEEVRKVA